MKRFTVALLVLAAFTFLLVGIPLATAHSETTSASADPGAASSTWRVLMLVFQETDTDYLGEDGRWHHLTTSLTDSDIDAMLASFTGPVAAAVRDWSAGAVQWDIDVKYAPRPVTHLSRPDANGEQWLDPGSIQDVIDGCCPDDVYDQIMVYWKSSDGSTFIPSPGWGLALPYSPSQNWGYLTVTALPADWWNPSCADIISQVWIHEWLHCACSFYATKGYAMPARDADGGELHGYVEDQGGLPGWGAFYADLMQGRVLEDGRELGITREAWLSGAIRTEAPSTTTTTTEVAPPSSTTSTTLPAAKHFSDIASSPYKTAIQTMAARGIIAGYSDGTFRPNNLVMRKHFAKMIVGVMGLPVTEADWQDARPPFTDCGKDNPTDLYPHDFIAVAKAHGLTLGVTATRFAPDANITRAQVATMVVRAARNSGITLKPVRTDYAGPFRTYANATHGANVKLADHNGLLRDLVTDGTISAWMDAKATRGEVAQILYNLMLCSQ
ncbi:MAG: S-layer homology domain-containing protein [Thermoleophilia bacterium]